MTLSSKDSTVVARAVEEVVLGTVRDLLRFTLPIFLPIMTNDQRQVMDIMILTSQIDVLRDAGHLTYPLQHGVDYSDIYRNKG